MAIAEFAFNNKLYIRTKSSPFKVNYRREPRMGFDIRKKRKHVKAEDFVKEIKNKHEKAKTALVKSQKEMKRYVNRKKAEEYRVGDKVLISTKDFLVDEESNKEVNGKVYWTLCSQENHIRKCSIVRVTSSVENTPGC